MKSLAIFYEGYQLLLCNLWVFPILALWPQTFRVTWITLNSKQYVLDVVDSESLGLFPTLKMSFLGNHFLFNSLPLFDLVCNNFPFLANI